MPDRACHGACHGTVTRAAAPYQTFRDRAACLSRDTSYRRATQWSSEEAQHRCLPRPTKPRPLLIQPTQSRRQQVDVLSCGGESSLLILIIRYFGHRNMFPVSTSRMKPRIGVHLENQNWPLELLVMAVGSISVGWRFGAMTG